jgi:UDP-glucose 6-dehydrogenase
LLKSLLEKGCRVRVYDPAAIDNFRKIFDNTVAYAENAQDCIRDADLAIIVTEWDEFRKLSPEDFVKLMKKTSLDRRVDAYTTRKNMWQGYVCRGRSRTTLSGSLC